MSQAKTITIEEFNRLQERLGRSRSGIRNQTMIYLEPPYTIKNCLPMPNIEYELLTDINNSKENEKE